MNISGSGHLNAGEYKEKISVSGSGRIDGNIRCIALSCSGSLQSTGSVTCTEDIRVSGACKVNKCVQSANILSSGSFESGEDVTILQTIRTSGLFSCNGRLKCAFLHNSGSLTIGLDAEAEEVRIAGRITCAGLLNAEKIDLSAVGTIGAIGGSEIRIKNSFCRRLRFTRLPLLSQLLGSGDSHVLNVKEGIEGDIVAVEGVRTPKIVGRVVAIGANCDVACVQYNETIEIHPDAHVGSYEKI